MGNPALSSLVLRDQAALKCAEEAPCAHAPWVALDTCDWLQEPSLGIQYYE